MLDYTTKRKSLKGEKFLRPPSKVNIHNMQASMLVCDINSYSLEFRRDMFFFLLLFAVYSLPFTFVSEWRQFATVSYKVEDVTVYMTPFLQRIQCTSIFHVQITS